MVRHRLHPAVAVLVAAIVGAGALCTAGVAGAQTTTTTPPVTIVTTTVPVTTPPTTATPDTTVAGGGTATTVAPPTTASTTPAATSDESDDDGSSIPWVPIAIGAAALVVLVAIVAMIARKRGGARQRAADWHRQAADATAEAGATARLLSQGTPPSGQIAQQLVTSMHAFEDLTETAPDSASAATAERARRALQMLGLAIDSDYRLRRARPPAEPEQLTHSQEAVQHAAGEADRTLRGVYRTFTGND